MRTWDEAERDHASQARQRTLELAAEVEGMVAAFEQLARPSSFAGRAESMERHLEMVAARLRGVEASAATLRNIAALRAEDPDHPGTP